MTGAKGPVRPGLDVTEGEEHLAEDCGVLRGRDGMKRAHPSEEKVLVPLDGSALSHGILTFVRRLLLDDGAEVKLVRVVTHEDLDDLGVASTPWWGSVAGSRDLARESGFLKILVPLDGSERANAVIPLVAAIAEKRASEVQLLHVARRGTVGVPSCAYEPALAGLANVRCSIKIVEGKPAPVILETISSGLFDLVASTTHGRSGESPWPFGATAEHVLRDCPVPLLVARTRETSRETPGAPFERSWVMSRKS